MKRNSSSTDAIRVWLRTFTKVALVNVAILLLLLVPIELIFGNWIRPIGIDDLKRFSIPIGISYQYDVSTLYESDIGPRITYTRDKWGLRGTYPSLHSIDLVTVGGSTTDQKFLDDSRTWQAYTVRELDRLGLPLVIANAGVDGQSTVGHLFNFQYWFPLLADLRPKYILFYLGVNDVLKIKHREDFDAKIDASSWRSKSAMWQFIRTVRDNLVARSVQVSHGRMPPLTDTDFTETGFLPPPDRTVLATEIAQAFVANVEKLRHAARQFGAVPIFVTQTPYAWNAGAGHPRGLKQHLVVHDREMSYADVSFLHQAMNRGLLEYCQSQAVLCFDLAGDVKFDSSDYYDFVHHSPKGAQRIGRYLAKKLVSLPTAPPAKPQH